MLLNDFFSIDELKTEGEQTTALITINGNHPIFEGHFPGNPIVPGVTMLQMVKEILSQVHQQKLTLSKTKNAKFTAILNPEVDPQVTFNIKSSPTETGWKTSGSITKESTTFFKFAAQLNH